VLSTGRGLGIRTVDVFTRYRRALGTVNRERGRGCGVIGRKSGMCVFHVNVVAAQQGTSRHVTIVDTRSVMLVDEDVDFILLSCKVTEQHHINYY
jgi:hypothetical protein